MPPFEPVLIVECFDLVHRLCYLLPNLIVSCFDLVLRLCQSVRHKEETQRVKTRELISARKPHKHNTDLWWSLQYLVFTCMPGKSYRRRLRSSLCLCDVLRALINSLVCLFLFSFIVISSVSVVETATPAVNFFFIHWLSLSAFFPPDF